MTDAARPDPLVRPSSVDEARALYSDARVRKTFPPGILKNEPGDVEFFGATVEGQVKAIGVDAKGQTLYCIDYDPVEVKFGYSDGSIEIREEQNCEDVPWEEFVTVRKEWLRFHSRNTAAVPRSAQSEQ